MGRTVPRHLRTCTVFGNECSGVAGGRLGREGEVEGGAALKMMGVDDPKLLPRLVASTPTDLPAGSVELALTLPMDLLRASGPAVDEFDDEGRRKPKKKAKPSGRSLRVHVLVMADGARSWMRARARSLRAMADGL